MPDTTASDWSNLPADHILSKFHAELSAILADTKHNEMYGVTLQAPEEGNPPVHTTLLILQKFLRANANDLPKARTQLIAALKWRKSYNPLATLGETFSKQKFGGLGYITTLHGVQGTGNDQDVATFNIYGAAAKDFRNTFGDTEAFVRWRVALMELTLQRLNLPNATKIIPDYGQGPDPYQAIAIHDYLSVSFFRQPSDVKASSTRIIDMFQKFYPETVSLKYFVNVPLVMQWMMGAMKMLMSSDAVQKMTWMTYGSQLVQFLGEGVPVEYGGKGGALAETGVTVRLDGGGESKDEP